MSYGNPSRSISGIARDSASIVKEVEARASDKVHFKEPTCKPVERTTQIRQEIELMAQHLETLNTQLTNLEKSIDPVLRPNNCVNDCDEAAEKEEPRAALASVLRSFNYRIGGAIERVREINSRVEV